MVALSLHEEPLLPCFPKSITVREVDETFGLTGSLWPYLYHLAILLARHKRGENVTNDASILERQLSSWSIEDVAVSPDVDKEAMMQIAQTYKYSALLMLYTGLLVPSGMIVNQTQVADIQRAAIDSLLRVCVLSGTMSTLTWPLYTVAMSSTSASDKIVLQHVFSKLLERQNMKVVEGARDKILQAWNTKDPDAVTQCDPQTPEVLLG